MFFKRFNQKRTADFYKMRFSFVQIIVYCPVFAYILFFLVSYFFLYSLLYLYTYPRCLSDDIAFS